MRKSCQCSCVVHTVYDAMLVRMINTKTRTLLNIRAQLLTVFIGMLFNFIFMCFSVLVCRLFIPCDIDLTESECVSKLNHQHKWRKRISSTEHKHFMWIWMHEIWFYCIDWIWSFGDRKVSISHSKWREREKSGQLW